jgi:hypothetical protein
MGGVEGGHRHRPGDRQGRGNAQPRHHYKAGKQQETGHRGDHDTGHKNTIPAF